MELGQALVLGSIFFLVFGFPVFVLVFMIVHSKLAKLFDQEVFSEEHFTPYELETFKHFPMSMIKTVAYIRGTLWPNSIEQRFGGYDFRSRMPSWLYRLCQLFPVYPILGTLIAIVMILSAVALKVR